MRSVDSRKLRQSAKYALVGALVTGLFTLLGYRLGFDIGVTAPAYLLIIVLQSLTGDFLSSALVSVLAVGCLDFFFIEPVLTFNVVRPQDAFALGSFLITALVITRLVSRLRVEVSITKIQKERLDHLYQLSQQLLSLEPDAPGEKFLEPFHRLFGVTAISMFDAETGESQMVGGSRNQLADKTRDAYIAGHDTSDGAAGVSVRCLQLGGKLTGAIGFESLEDPEQTVGPLAALTSAHLAKTKAFRSASAASAATQAEVYRSAILDALAHEFKTPLATILAAAGGLREAGSLSSEQSEMADTVETEADRLGRLTSRLLRVARLDREEVRPRIEMTDIGALVDHIADQYSRQWPERRISVASHGEPTEEPADPQLLRLALSQLLDNACKYSPPGSAVRIALDYDQDGFAIEVSNSGSSIPPSEQRLIFERFYRGAETKRHTAGSGLGLYVARKIALAHSGSLQLVTEDGTSRGVAFRLKIPSFQLQADHAAVSK
jgi:two-component system, OmpR family, sensor histidine kinase KdpD